jgi:hypothetical protein
MFNSNLQLIDWFFSSSRGRLLQHACGRSCKGSVCQASRPYDPPPGPFTFSPRLNFNFVAEEGNDEGACRDYDNTGVPWDVAVDGVNKLRADYDIDGRPAEAGKAIEDGDDFDSVVSEKES